MKRAVLSFALVLYMLIGVKAQTPVVAFDYDDAGNRILRQIKIEILEKSDPLNTSDSLFARLPYQPIEGVRVYPNPASEAVNIEFTTLPEANTVFVLRDMHGRLLEQGNIQHTLTPLDIKHLGKGTYPLLITAGDKNEKFKIIKQ